MLAEVVPSDAEPEVDEAKSARDMPHAESAFKVFCAKTGDGTAMTRYEYFAPDDAELVGAVHETATEVPNDTAVTVGLDKTAKLAP